MTTPKRYAIIKRDFPGSLLLVRTGDFYEAFHEDAVTAARILGLVVTTRINGKKSMPMTGFPCHSLDQYIDKLKAADIRVAIVMNYE
ncbi:hypothetical protein LCGC14_0336840 [marine sediment metagenome]|uniref:DNA mismatch repair protein MutS-like N-terminal domain-containing protein n=1 Tax=marine sediment metagenome TaxID=412755 RepID=A0A0F9TKQ2_9ZZZZ